MNTIKQINWSFNPFYKEAWYRLAGVMYKEEQQESFDSLSESEWSEEFEFLMKNRLILGALRYGKMGHGSTPSNKPTYDRCSSIRKRLAKFEESGNLEWLVDVANEALLIFEERQHPNAHFEAAGVDTDIHTEIKK